MIATGIRTRAFALMAVAIREFGEILGAGAEGIFAPS
jgi:hypothetical protein